MSWNMIDQKNVDSANYFNSGNWELNFSVWNWIWIALILTTDTESGNANVLLRDSTFAHTTFSDLELIEWMFGFAQRYWFSITLLSLCMYSVGWRATAHCTCMCSLSCPDVKHVLPPVHGSNWQYEETECTWGRVVACDRYTCTLIDL